RSATRRCGELFRPSLVLLLLWVATALLLTLCIGLVLAQGKIEKIMRPVPMGKRNLMTLRQAAQITASSKLEKLQLLAVCFSIGATLFLAGVGASALVILYFTSRG
ncbi:MAG: hypothetical protein ACRD5H_17865, partial [Nitrososphaerales archaeon]